MTSLGEIAQPSDSFLTHTLPAYWRKLLGETHDRLLCCVGHFGVRARPTVKRVIAVDPIFGVDRVVAGPAEELVGPTLAFEDVVAAQALYGVVTSATADDVVTRSAAEAIRPRGPIYGA